MANLDYDKMTTQRQKQCGVIMPISGGEGYPASHWTEVLSIIKETLTGTDFAVELVSNADEVGVIQKRIVQNIYENEIVICDVSSKNPNVMFELGMRLAFDKPAIIIKDDQTNYIFDTGQIEHIGYPRNLNYHAIQEFKSKLRSKLLATYDSSQQPNYTTFLAHFGKFVTTNLDEEVVSKDTYLIKSISDLQKDLSAIKNSLRSPTVRALEQRSLLVPKPADSMKSYIADYLSKLTHKLDWKKLEDISSNEFTELLEQYFSIYYPGIEVSSEFRARATTLLAFELQELRAYH